MYGPRDVIICKNLAFPAAASVPAITGVPALADVSAFADVSAVVDVLLLLATRVCIRSQLFLASLGLLSLILSVTGGIECPSLCLSCNSVAGVPA
jgi:hypothetical protein